MARRDSSGSNVSQHDEIRNLPYFHNQFESTEEVTTFLKKKSKKQPGYYLLRPSNRRRNLLTASITVPDSSVRHTHIQIEENGSSRLYFLVVEKKFSSVEDLIYFYRDHPVKNLENVENVYFKKPIMNPHYVGNGSCVNGAMGRSSSMSSMQNPPNGNRYIPTPAEAFSPPLPRPRTESSNSLSSNSSQMASSGSNPSLRPPLPLPDAGFHDDAGPYMYSHARNVEEDVSDKLKEALKQAERCECGIARHMAELPLGWTVHRSKEPPTVGKLFYQNDNGLTSWSLPQNVKMQLTHKHMANLRRLDPESGQGATLPRPKR